MIVCHCMHISDHDIRAAVDWMRAADARTVITPGRIYHALGKRADCGGCLPLFVETMRGCDSLEVPAPLRGLRRCEPKGGSDERRQEGHRVPELRAAE
ncbi:(2Fe-2S)-binding protein [Defluviimonas sp. D31]|uniref:(2Fe-2S)-binding protein n=1 Tax=Defluviimonas sp. D31 TaxID=3083253 RepID=UPI00296F0317|nr:(2Fe-2S)-binding protein [Defluviimonas sp. D31]MDW4550069.1 (2Fe-2S)-binding protein [Defluviimonas sp. D31]